ncbi:MAG TPA: cupin domain-containing protein [Thermomicrobiales bacterium]|nr:cupin domain-containing protein [Thermomicrobiales bacterium]
MSVSSIYGPALLDEEIARYQPGDRESASGRRSEILVKTDDLRVLLVTMREGATLAEHSAPGTITIHVIAGEMVVEADGATHELDAGSLVSLAAGVRHSVRARSSGAFLLTIAWSSRNVG